MTPVQPARPVEGRAGLGGRAAAVLLLQARRVGGRRGTSGQVQVGLSLGPAPRGLGTKVMVAAK